MSEVESGTWNSDYNPYVAPTQSQPSMSNDQFIRSAYNQYLGRQPTAQEISKQLAEGTQRQESQQQWLSRVTQGMQPIKGAPAAGWTPTNIDPVAAKAAYTKSKMNPYYGGGGDREAFGDPSAGNDWANIQAQIASNVRKAPGTRPDVGYIPGLGAIDLLTYTPFDWQDNSRRRGGGLTDVERSLTDYFGAHPEIGMPRFQDVRGDFTPSGRGYSYAGPASQRELDLVNSGQINPNTVKEYAQLAGQRIRENKPSSMQRFASQYYGPGLMAIAGAAGGAGIGGLGGAAFGAGWGALSQGAQTKFKDPLAIGAGALGGALGGWGGGAAGGALGLGNVGTGALAGAGGSLGRDLVSGAVKGKFNPYATLRNAGIGAVTGGAMGGLRGLGQGSVINTPGEPGGAVVEGPTVNPKFLAATTPQVGSAMGKTLDYYLPGRQEARPPQQQLQRRRKRPQG